ncbi:MAG TPA: cytochrome c oxidase subunit II [Alphaproteobacteria bacterium]|jgi:cytochrome c oxidase subunit 2|nr:cytochrome c oxidase subunit II [Alphaproteobacteria bacterium]
MSWKQTSAALIGIVTALLLGGPAAQAAQPQPWQLGFQPAVTPVMGAIDNFYDLLLVIIFAIAIFVMMLLAIIIVRFNAKANPTPSRRSHHTLLEVAWTVIPILILVVIAVPSFKLLYLEKDIPKADMTLKVVGNQFYWTYQYPDHGGFEMDANMVADEDLKPDQPRLLETDNHVVLPVDTTIRIIITAGDVIHAWAVPAFGIKMDAVPGRLNQTWVRIESPGTYYGQCSEFCGQAHGFMPITVRAVSKQDFAAWVVKAKQEYSAQTPAKPTRLAQKTPAVAGE